MSEKSDSIFRNALQAQFEPSYVNLTFHELNPSESKLLREFAEDNGLYYTEEESYT